MLKRAFETRIDPCRFGSQCGFSLIIVALPPWSSAAPGSSTRQDRAAAHVNGVELF